VVEREVKEWSPRHSSLPLERLRRPLFDLAKHVERGVEFRPVRSRRIGRQGRGPRHALGIAEEEVAVPEASQRVEQRVLRLPLRMHRLRLADEGEGICPGARLMLGIGQCGAFADPLEGIAAAIGEPYGFLRVPHRGSQLAQRQLQLAQVACADSGVLPILTTDLDRQPRSHGLQ
jgi:hypothetical protein